MIHETEFCQLIKNGKIKDNLFGYIKYLLYLYIVKKLITLTKKVFENR